MIYFGKKSSHYGLYRLGYARATEIKNNRKRQRNLELIPKNYFGSDCILKFIYMKLKLLVIVNHDDTVNFNEILHTPPITLKKFDE